ncbi:hypothetical protein J6590_026881 [Homalodisca vitripennis]|nr:hypothetical protein J6590_026881 [Homalodisca vitripennis]
MVYEEYSLGLARNNKFLTGFVQNPGQSLDFGLISSPKLWESYDSRNEDAGSAVPPIVPQRGTQQWLVTPAECVLAQDLQPSQGHVSSASRAQTKNENKAREMLRRRHYGVDTETAAAGATRCRCQPRCTTPWPLTPCITPECLASPPLVIVIRCWEQMHCRQVAAQRVQPTCCNVTVAQHSHRAIGASDD